MGWIEELLGRRSQQSEADGLAVERTFAEAARQRWRKLGEELGSDVAEFNARQDGASFNQTSEDQYQVRNARSGLEVVLTADFSAHTIRYDYAAFASKSAGVPEGGILSMRESRRGTVEFYSADERLTPEEMRQVVLEAVLFPPTLAA